ncbi:hypothetical protein [Streptomyces sp. NPDC058620]|uniref:hypothetical protein n=1 Tax=Streptomyces sp. NPDC058620 TaxID=3346560 RepID=UPI003668C5FD
MFTFGVLALMLVIVAIVWAVLGVHGLLLGRMATGCSNECGIRGSGERAPY